MVAKAPPSTNTTTPLQRRAFPSNETQIGPAEQSKYRGSTIGRAVPQTSASKDSPFQPRLEAAFPRRSVGRPGFRHRPLSRRGLSRLTFRIAGRIRRFFKNRIGDVSL